MRSPGRRTKPSVSESMTQLMKGWCGRISTVSTQQQVEVEVEGTLAYLTDMIAFH